MSIKKTALIVATVASSFSVASTAHADSYFASGNVNQTAPMLDTQFVVAEAAGVVKFYEANNGEKTRLIDSFLVNAGVNYDVDVSLDRVEVEEVIAVLEIDGQTVASKVYTFDN